MATETPSNRIKRKVNVIESDDESEDFESFPEVESSEIFPNMCCSCGRCVYCLDIASHPETHALCRLKLTSKGLPKTGALNKANEMRDKKYKDLVAPSLFGIAFAKKRAIVSLFLKERRPNTPFILPVTLKHVLVCADCLEEYSSFVQAGMTLLI
jgi:hypothetical protein